MIKKFELFFSSAVTSIALANVRRRNISISAILKGRKLSWKSHKIYVFFLLFNKMLRRLKCNSLKIILIYLNRGLLQLTLNKKKIEKLFQNVELSAVFLRSILWNFTVSISLSTEKIKYQNVNPKITTITPL